MKSAYELAMERLEKQSPTAKLTEAQKAEVNELESLYKAKKAEKELFIRGEIAKAAESADSQAIDQLNDQLARELRRIDGELEAKKEKIRASR